MGLFGGFRAKFSRTSRSKEAEPRTGVVPLHYRINSEFDSDSYPSQLPNGIEPAPFRTVSRPPTRSSTFENHKRALLEKLTGQLQAHNQLTKSTPEGDSEEQSTTNGAKSIRFQEQPTVLDEVYNATNSVYTNSNAQPKSNNVKKEEEDSNYIYTGVTGSPHHYEQVQNVEEEEDRVSYRTLTQRESKPELPARTFEYYDEEPPSTLIMMTQHEPDDTESKPKPVARAFEYLDDEATYVPEAVYNDDEPERFEVNVMQHDDYVSEDELSYVEDEAPVSYTGYSSQAANIFFGDTAPPPVRPRKVNKIVLGNDEEEEDC